MICIQHKLLLPEKTYGIYPITKEIVAAVPELGEILAGTLHIFLQHTSASLTINENADGDVLTDLDDRLARLAPESAGYRHIIEGADDMPGHIKSSLLGVSLTIPVAAGKLLLGTWQDIYLCEHRREPHRRNIVLTLTGTGKEKR